MKNIIVLLLVFFFAGSASAVVVGEWLFDTIQGNITPNTGAAAPLGDGTLSGPDVIIQNGELHQLAAGSRMACGGGSDWTMFSANNNYNAFNLMIGNFSIEFDVVSRDAGYTGWNEPASKYNVGAARSDWIMEMVGPSTAVDVMWKSYYNPSNVGTYVHATVDFTQGPVNIRGERIVIGSIIVTRIYVNNVLAGEISSTGDTIAVNGGDIEFGGNSKYPGDSGPITMDNIRYTDTPEPATMGLLGLGALALIRRKRG